MSTSTTANANANATSSGLVDVKTCDYLDQDPELRGQRFVCMSFVSPEDVIQRKEVAFFHDFLSTFSKDLSELFANLKTKLGTEDSEMVDGLKSRYDYVFDAAALSDEFDFYKQTNSDKLEREYLEKNNFQTSIRGIKVRGTYDNLVEAQRRAEAIKKFDRAHNVYVGEVGAWCPWSPYPEEIENVEYSETQMNTLMKKYKENQSEKNEHFRMRRDAMMDRANALNEQKKAAAAKSATTPTDDATISNTSASTINTLFEAPDVATGADIVQEI